MVSTLAAMPPAVTWRHRWPALGAAVLLGGTAVRQFATLSAGTVDPVTAAAVKSGSESVISWIFGSMDGGNAVTLSGPPAALWPMVLSVRLFGFSTFSLLLPQALLGVGAVALTWAAVRHRFGDVAGLAAGAIVALATLLTTAFHSTSSAALLLFLLTIAGYAVVRALDRGDWLIAAGTALGFAFLTEPTAALLALPAYGLCYLVAASQPLTERLRYLAGALCAMIISAGWFLLLVAWWPADQRPYVSWWDGGAWRQLLAHPSLGVGWLPAAALLLLTGVVLWRRRRTAALVLGAVALLLGSVGAVSTTAATPTAATSATTAAAAPGTSSPVTSIAVADQLCGTDSRWSAAVLGESDAAAAMLATNTSVLPLGGPDGAGPAPTLAQFQTYVSNGEVSYLLVNGAAPAAEQDSVAAQITDWVQQNYPATEIGGATVYDLR